jgi:hypothetical protein
MLIFQPAGAAGPGPTYATNQQFEAHQWVADGNAGVGYTFLQAGAPNVQALANPSLRVSDNGLLAIEDADLTRRQPKHFFAAAGSIDGWNRQLARLGTMFQLVPDPAATVTFTLPGAAAARTLVRVHPANLRQGNAGNAMTITENCDTNICEVTASHGEPIPRFGRPVFTGTTLAQNGFFEYHVANELAHGHPGADLPTAPVAAFHAAQDTIAQDYGQSIRALALGNPVPNNPNLANDLQAIGVNRHARPAGIGQGLYTASLGSRHVLAGGQQQIQDYANNRLLGPVNDINQAVWGFHWGGVVAIDGTDYVTLENYARNGENAFGAGGRLFYFQMYGADAGRTWHEQWETPHVRGKAFVNGLTTVVERRPPPGGGLQYFVAGSKNTHGAVAAAGDIQQLQRALLNALNYATVHRYATSLADEFADRTRLHNWRNAVANLLGAPPAFIDQTTTALANYVAGQLAQVRHPPI